MKGAKDSKPKLPIEGAARFKMNRRRWFFTEFVVDLYNSFPGDSLDVDIHRFKGRLEKYLEQGNLWTY